MALYGTVSPGNPPSFRNIVINGDMSVWQRGTSFTNATGVYGADRWYSYRPSTTQQSNSDNGGYSLRWTYNSNYAGQGNFVSQGVEGINCVHLRGRQVTLSFEVKTSSSFNSGRFKYDIIENTGTADLNPNGVGQTITQSVATTTSFVRVSRTYTLSSSFNNLYISFTLDSATTNEWYEIRNVQLEEGSVATPFEKRPYGTELALCQRYYVNLQDQPHSTPAYYGMGAATTAVWLYSQLALPVPMRVTPSPTMTVSSLAGLSSAAAYGRTSTRIEIQGRTSGSTTDAYFYTSVFNVSAEL